MHRSSVAAKYSIHRMRRPEEEAAIEEMMITFVHPASLLILRGVERWLLEVSKEMSARDLKATVLTLGVGLEDYLGENEDIKIRLRNVLQSVAEGRGVEWKELRGIRPRFASIKILDRFFKWSGISVPLDMELIRQLPHSDVVYVVSGDAYQALTLLLISILAGARRLVLGIHSRPPYDRFVRLRKPFDFLSRTGFLKAVHVVNPVDKLMLEQILKSRVVHIPNGVSCHRFKPDLGAKRTFQVLFVGALSPDKGIDIFPEILLLLKRREIKPKITIVSTGGPLLDPVRKWVETGDGEIELKGFVEDDELAKLYAEATVVLLPSRDEAFGLVALEAQASGTPVICSNTSGFRQTVLDGVTGFIVSRWSAGMFSEAVAKIHQLWLQDKERYSSMCLDARNHVKRSFGWDIVVDSLMDLFI